METNAKSGRFPDAPRVWIVASPHAGDNTQLRALGQALGWSVETKHLVYRPSEAALRFLSLPTLAGVDLVSSSAITPPWPDLVLCSGRGAEAVAFWIRKQHPQTRIAFVGTPWAPLARFDLVVTTPQYRLPAAPNVLHNLLPLHDVTPERLTAEAERWEARFALMPKPLTAVLVGGRSGPYHFTRQAASRLGHAVTELARAEGGSLLITTSARTGTAATEALKAAIGVPSHVHRWMRGGGENPFHAFLGLAQRIVVTADSISMMAEAIASRKPVLLFDIEDGPYAMRAEEQSANAVDGVPPISWRGRSAGATLFRLLINHAPPRFSRDLRIVQRALVKGGYAQWLGDPPPPGPPPAAPDELGRTVARIRQLFGL
ncbi:MAG: mitochondrial fission ELM1 family protein [Aestuariivirga sp.]|uniref:mitochondrial fission ELM1 family protein n=1 Tax=Aestuariivirga sp. TaxID=2650926 RepID=UPI0038CF6B25